MATARSAIFSSPAGTSSLALANGGTSDSVATEEWTQVNAIKTVDLS
jgi:hypothetical protein